MAVIELKYRTRPPHVVTNEEIQAITLLDAKRAMRLVRHRSKECGINPGLSFRSTDGEFTGVGLFAAVSYDEGKTWPDRRLIVGPSERIANANGSPANINGYLAITQTRDGRILLRTRSKHYTFNLAWLKQQPIR